MVTPEQIKTVINLIAANTSPERILMFGSYASGNPTQDSDLDLLVVKNNVNAERHKRGREIRKYLRGLKIPIDLVAYTEQELHEWKDVQSSFASKVLSEGKVVYEKKKKT